MASFRLCHDEYQHELPWRLMQNGPVTMYLDCEVLDADIAELGRNGFTIRRSNCAALRSDAEMHATLRAGLGLPEYTGANFDALADSLEEVDVPESGGLAIVLDDFDGHERRNEQLLRVLRGCISLVAALRAPRRDSSPNRRYALRGASRPRCDPRTVERPGWMTAGRGGAGT